MDGNGTHVVLEDLATKTRWRLDESTRYVAKGIAGYHRPPYAAAAVTGPNSPVHTIGPGVATKEGEETIRVVHHNAAGTVTIRWVMEPDRLRILADSNPTEGITSLTLPGTFRPEDGGGFLSAVPQCQGILHSGKGPPFYRALRGFTMAMFGQIASRGGLLIIAATNADAALHWEKTETGTVNLMWLQHPSMGQFTYTRETVIIPASPEVASICKSYRRYVKEKGRFKSWQEKIAERPNLERLFGAAMVFIGYHDDPELDYAASFRRLKAMGIDKAFVYPLYCATTMDVEKSMGVSAIDQRKLLPLLDELGYAAASFIYIMDGAAEPADDPYRDLLLDRHGKPVEKWRINDLVWYAFSTSKRFDWSRKFLDREHAGFHGMHYDVLAGTPLKEDYHGGHRSDARADQENRKEMLAYAAGKGLIVSSECFRDYLTPYYDLGSTKYPFALGGDEYCVVPMTMLVYHDSAYHSWWEIDNYNNPQNQSQDNRGYKDRFAMAGGVPRLQSAMDALLGTLPDIFPFGKQFNFIPHNAPQIYFYKYRLEDAAVQEAIAYAKPVMALNKRIGKLEMIDHRLHRPDGAIQETVFADGTRVAANFANVALEAADLGLLAPESWKIVE
jgi:hypothetical protein